MFRRLAFLTFCAFGLPLSASATMSDVSCDDRSRLTATLQQTLQATRQGTGLRDPETMLEVWVTPSNGDWLIVQHYSSGVSCIVAMGEYWEATAPSSSS